MAFGFPAHFTESRTFDLAENELFKVIKSAFENLKWVDYKIQEETVFRKLLHNSPMTFGEDFTVKILPGGVVQAESRCVEGGLYQMPQIFDFGANRQNVEAFFAQIERDIYVKKSKSA